MVVERVGAGARLPRCNAHLRRCGCVTSGEFPNHSVSEDINSTYPIRIK